MKWYKSATSGGRLDNVALDRWHLQNFEPKPFASTPKMREGDFTSSGVM
jgi:hypothetical protein